MFWASFVVAGSGRLWIYISWNPGMCSWVRKRGSQNSLGAIRTGRLMPMRNGGRPSEEEILLAVVRERERERDRYRGHPIGRGIEDKGKQ